MTAQSNLDTRTNTREIARWIARKLWDTRNDTALWWSNFTLTNYTTLQDANYNIKYPLYRAIRDDIGYTAWEAAISEYANFKLDTLMYKR